MPTLIESHEKNDFRVVLLLDLDCFYAQCECVRLGWNASDTPLALLQWNSVLAVTYPARKFGIKRGDSWQQVKSKSNGQCHAVHVPILRTTSSDVASKDPQSDGDLPQEDVNATGKSLQDDEVESDYASVFELSSEQQEQARKNSLGVRFYSHQGKACIERYRTASARIFETVFECINDYNHRGVVLERASIDEFFLDVTALCTLNGGGGTSDEDALKSTLPADTKVIGTSQSEPRETDQAPEEIGDRGCVNRDETVVDEALKRGCQVAFQIRQHLLETLGFTLSAGIACNKTLAKLSASYGKSNGQAVLFPKYETFILDETPISKCRNLGGKLGGRVQAMLPADCAKTLSCIRKFLSMSDLQDALGTDTARWVMQIARGIDHEAVVAKSSESSLSHVPKSITAFKSLGKPHTFEAIDQWIRLLAKEIVTRVERDASRNHRYPKSCNIVYHVAGRFDGGRSRNTSARISFPAERLSTHDKIQELVRRIPEVVRAKEAPETVSLDRIGLCAIDFLSRASDANAIRNYFASSTTSRETNQAKDSIPQSTETRSTDNEPGTSYQVSDHRDARRVATESDLEMAMRLQSEYNGENRILRAVDDASERATKGQSHKVRAATIKPRTATIEDRDVALAKRLQAEYDRELRLAQAMDRRDKEADATSGQPPPKARKIDSFFRKR